MARSKGQENTGMLRSRESGNPPTPTTRRGFNMAQSSAQSGFNATNLDKLISICDECIEECRNQGLDDKVEECEGLKTQCESAKSALASGAAMATDWMAFAMLALQMFLEYLKKRQEPKPATE